MRARNRGLYYVSSCALSSRASSTVCDWHPIVSAHAQHKVCESQTFATSTTSNGIDSGTPLCSKCTENAMNARWLGDVQALKTVKTVWVAATSDEVHSTQGLLEAQGDSQRLGNKGERVWRKAQSLLK